MTELIEQLKERARDPKRATDESPVKGKTRVPAPATEEQIAAAEAKLGFALPALLRQIYLEVGNGGVGPGYGLLGVPISEDDPKDSLVGQYLSLKAANTKPAWPKGLIPICDWGADIASYLDTTTPDVAVIRLDTNMPKADAAVRVPEPNRYPRAGEIKAACWIENASFAQWLEAWVNGRRLFYEAYGGTDDEIDLYADEEDEEEE